MKIEKTNKEPDFKPITLHITIENVGELEMLKEMSLRDIRIPELISKCHYGDCQDFLIKLRRILPDN